MTKPETVFVPVTYVGTHAFIWGKLNGGTEPRFIRVAGVQAVPGVGVCVELELDRRGRNTVIVRFANGETAEVETPPAAREFPRLAG